MSDPLRVANEIKATILTTPAERSDGASKAVERSKEMMKLGPVGSFLGVYQPSGEQGDQLRYINNFFTDGEKNIESADLLSRIRSVERKLAPPKLGETRVGKLYAYVKALNAVRGATKTAEAYEA